MNKFYSPASDTKTIKSDDVSSALDQQMDDDDLMEDNGQMETTTMRTGQRKSQRGLSKYGPWGYLILGMLLCGGTLLLCVMWGMYNKTTYWQTFSVNLS